MMAVLIMNAGKVVIVGMNRRGEVKRVRGDELKTTRDFGGQGIYACIL